MSDSLEWYLAYKCRLLIYGYTQTYMDRLILDDLCNICVNYIGFPDNDIVDPNISKLEYLLFTEMGKSSMMVHTFHSFHSLLYNRRWLHLLNDNYVEHVSFYGLQWLKDKSLFESLSFCINWAYCMREKIFPRGNDISDYQYNYEIVQIYLNVVINVIKKGIQLRYKYVLELISMYEYYYFDLYLLKRVFYVKEKLNQTQYKSLINYWNTQCHFGKEFCSCLNVDFAKWSNKNSMKMSALLQVITIEYSDNINRLMCELDTIRDCIQIKYQIMQSRIFDSCLMLDTKGCIKINWKKVIASIGKF
eukprot:477667_1